MPLLLPAVVAVTNGVVVPAAESNGSVISSSSMSPALTKSLLSGRIMSAVNCFVLSLLGVWGDSDTDGDMAGVAMTGMWSLSLIKGKLFLNCAGSLLPNRVLKT